MAVSNSRFVYSPKMLLIAGHCEDCDWHFAMPEGSMWPICPGCEQQMEPPEAKQYLVTGEQRDAYLAECMGEYDVVQTLRLFVERDSGEYAHHDHPEDEADGKPGSAHG